MFYLHPPLQRSLWAALQPTCSWHSSPQSSPSPLPLHSSAAQPQTTPTTYLRRPEAGEPSGRAYRAKQIGGSTCSMHMQHADAALGPWEARNWLGLQTSRTEVWQIGTNRTEWRTTYFSLNSGQKESATIPWFNEQCLTGPDACRPRPWDKWHLIHLTIVSTEPHRPIFVSHTNYGATQSTVRLF